jgi:hypothetical protein
MYETMIYWETANVLSNQSPCHRWARAGCSGVQAGLVDRCQLFLTPVLVGGGKPALPKMVRLDLDRVTQRRFDSGVVFLAYRVRRTVEASVCSSA